jgi:hypothetical protein
MEKCHLVMRKKNLLFALDVGLANQFVLLELSMAFCSKSGGK